MVTTEYSCTTCSCFYKGTQNNSLLLSSMEKSFWSILMVLHCYNNNEIDRNLGGALKQHFSIIGSANI